MHYFRAFAIINIMVVHIWHFDHGSTNSLIISSLRESLFHSSTIYFVFISGFLFQYLSHNFNTKKYYKAKIKNVITPYILFSSLCLLRIVYAQNYESFSHTLFSIFFLGQGQNQYWYIPFISIVFLISPLLLQLKGGIFRTIFIASLFIPLLGTRTGTDISIGQYLYFLPVYIVGMGFARNYQQCMAVIKKYITSILSVAVATTFALLVIEFYQINLFPKETLYYVQKGLLTVAAIHMLEKVQHKYSLTADLLAKYSFSLYFMHTLVDITPFRSLFDDAVGTSWLLLPASVVYTLAIIALTLLICIAAKKILGKRSRMIIGT